MDRGQAAGMPPHLPRFPQIARQCRGPPRRQQQPSRPPPPATGIRKASSVGNCCLQAGICIAACFYSLWIALRHRRLRWAIPPPLPAQHRRTWDPSSSVAFMPISARLPTVHPCKLAWWPMVTLSPMTVSAEWPVGNAPAVRMTHPSCTLLRSPMLILPQSAAAAAWGGRAGAGGRCGTAQQAQTVLLQQQRQRA